MATVNWTPPAPGAIPAPPLAPVYDIHSHANLLEIKPKHIDIEWTVDWVKRKLSGKVTHSIEVTKEGVDHFILDTSYLDVKRVSIGKEELKWEVGKRRGTLGSPLTIQLGSRKKGEDLKVEVEYSTTEQCTALGWLTAEQTESKKTPFLYSQAQAIHGRSMLPCVDSPSHKITYTAKVKSDIPILMSALAEGSIRASESGPGEAYSKEEGVYRFRQPVGIPTYLIAIVGGTLEFRPLASRVGVWAEPTMIDRAEWEFKEDANRYLEAAEETISPYSWSRYDCVVLPPSFPYGGMENANLTTLTPSLICGDRSQTDVLLHELAHSWSGNLTSCANWSSFWLNEGINVWIERLLLQVVHGPEIGPAYRGFSYIIGAKALQDALEQFESIKRFQRLVPVFHDGEDPDDAFSSIPYEKGSNFILHLERTVGGLALFLPFIQSHFKTFYDRSVTTEEWKQHLFDFYAGNAEITKKLEHVDWHGWLHGEGLHLPVKMEYDNTLAVESQDLADRWIKVIQGKKSAEEEKFSTSDIEGWHSNQVVVFLEKLHSGPKLSNHYTGLLDKTYNFSKQTNSEIKLRFYEVALEDPKTLYKEEAAKWVSKQGRMKYCRVMYRALNKVDAQLAKDTFIKHRSFYHPIAAAMIASDLALPRRPKGETLIAICGSTGTGKSQLAVELASHFGQMEVISADSMQIYHGLDTITNKMTSEEMQGIPHHLMSFLEPEKDAEYDVGSFVRDASNAMREMSNRDVLPIIVGGTTYYLQHFVLPGQLVSLQNREDDRIRQERPATVHEVKSATEVERIAEEASRVPLTTEQKLLLFRVINLSHSSSLKDVDDPMMIWTLLDCLDQEMAMRWHFRDTRKIIRSIKVLFETGRRHSELIEEQKRQRQYTDEDETIQGEEKTKLIIFNLECDRPVLNERLDLRIERMIDNGLLREIVELRAIVSKRGESKTDYTRGIFQAIGYKEFDSYLEHLESRRGGIGVANAATSLLRPSPDDKVGNSLFTQAVEDMKISTRQFAKRQVGWVRNMLLPELNKRHNRHVHFYSLDTTDLEQWQGNVRSKSIGLLDREWERERNEQNAKGECDAQALLERLEFVSDELSKCPREAEANGAADAVGADEEKLFTTCHVCTKDNSKPCMILNSKWDLHCKGRSHQAALRIRNGGKRVAMTGPEVEAKRKERQERRQGKAAPPL
ncbi:hypothetical protein CBS101457_004064 [Exobasidium rhododendri]|nr:hypothetical protein CBS101457_004064 [Exobasidium rhododendri]